MMFAMVPNQLVLEQGNLPLSELRIANAVMMDRKPLSALGADNGFHVAVRNFPQSSWTPDLTSVGPGAAVGHDRYARLGGTLCAAPEALLH
jgi:hypothetical protein